MRSARERVSIDLGELHKKVVSSAPRDYQLAFDLEMAVYTLLYLFAVNLSLYHTAFYNYHWSLLTFNICFLTRHVFSSLRRYVSIRDPLRRSEFGLAVGILCVTSALVQIYCIWKLFPAGWHIGMFIVIWVLAQYLCPGETKDRYLSGNVDAYQCWVTSMLRVVEITVFGSVLPYQLVARPGAYIDTINYVITVLSLLCAGASIVATELLRKRSLELNSYLRSMGNWELVVPSRHVVEEWKPERPYNRGELVRHANQTWRALGKVTTLCEPGKHEASALYRLFSSPAESLFKVKWATALATLLHLYCLLYLPYTASCCLAFACLLYAGIRSQLMPRLDTKET